MTLEARKTRDTLDISDQLDKNIDLIVQTIIEGTNPNQIIWFGSRVQGTAHPYSDYDIALVGAGMDHRTVRQLKETLDQHLGIYTVDLIDLDKVDLAFKQQVIHSGVIVYDHESACLRA